VAPVAVPAKTLTSSGLLHARAARRERHDGRHRVHAEDEQHVLHRPADAERLEQEPERREAAQPAGELDEPHLAQVAPAVAEDREALRTRAQNARTRPTAARSPRGRGTPAR
jgi:hypothetical protein